ncbi:2-amino-4-hydroxy-6-hydroxymethyldihydropteridine diphosphokinase [Actimicrobium antarcticum]|uniref:2-amino-4-hydroxy-6-hydroxymethyldihydropteridine pyrophosphokinase n=1 Tax=Actimicrobium antarcticum TaxID=1051899 RepID=A0ABP7TI79_9BURK
MTDCTVTAYIGLGANLGDAQDTVQRALLALAALPATRLTLQSSLFRTAPIEAAGDDFVNAVAQLSTTLGAHALLENMQQIEQSFGRERAYRNAPRTLDLDLLLYGTECIDTATLTVPHPRMTERAFTLIPLLQLDPLIEIPGCGAAHRFVPGVAGQAIQKM